MQRMEKNSGRTLLEMLGVLALIGLLTVGGMAFFGDATSQVRLNNLLDEVRKRALVAEKKSSKLTYGVFDKQAGGASAITSYGYGVGDNNTGVKREAALGYVAVPVGNVNGGKALDASVCKALMKRVQEEKKHYAKGEVVGIYEYSGGKCKKSKTDCTDEVPDVLCIGIKY
ncbi:MAG: hypothetical protein II938_04395 [Alphaproteobacteria bacterium]|nr:hypothetical protein [Alphaproteobacteria bacterium]